MRTCFVSRSGACALAAGWRWLNEGTIGRHNNKSACLPLRDLRVKRRHAHFKCEGVNYARQLLPAHGLWIQPHKAKLCKLLLGRAGHQLHPPWLLQPGDHFCVGHTHIRVMKLTRATYRVGSGSSNIDRERDDLASGGVMAPREQQLYAVVEDKGMRYRRAENKEKRRRRKQNGGSSDDDSDEMNGAKRSSDEETVSASGPTPLLRLQLVAGPWRGREMECSEEGCTLGSSKQCTLSLPRDASVEDVHATITHACGSWYLADAGSTMGTFLLLPDTGAQIDIGDVLSVGDSELTFFMQIAPTSHSQVDENGVGQTDGKQDMPMCPERQATKGTRAGQSKPRPSLANVCGWLKFKVLCRLAKAEKKSERYGRPYTPVPNVDCDAGIGNERRS